MLLFEVYFLLKIIMNIFFCYYFTIDSRKKTKKIRDYLSSKSDKISDVFNRTIFENEIENVFLTLPFLNVGVQQNYIHTNLSSSTYFAHFYATFHILLFARLLLSYSLRHQPKWYIYWDFFVSHFYLLRYFSIPKSNHSYIFFYQSARLQIEKCFRNHHHINYLHIRLYFSNQYLIVGFHKIFYIRIQVNSTKVVT